MGLEQQTVENATGVTFLCFLICGAKSLMQSASGGIGCDISTGPSVNRFA
jgi:hypothetical protein